MEVEQARAPRRPSRDLLPAFLAAGAVGLVVTVVVGGSTAGIDRVVPVPPPVASVAPVAAATAAGSGIEVAVRPARPRSIPVTAAGGGRLGIAIGCPLAGCSWAS